MFNLYNLSYERQDLTGKVVIVTGANIGIGYETAKAFAEMNAQVYLVCRNKEKAEAAIEKIKEVTKSEKVEFLPLDLISFDSVRRFVELFKEKENVLDILINNAGMISFDKQLSKDGYEVTMQVNYLSTILLTFLLLPLLKKSSASRIVNVASVGHNFATYDLSLLEKNAELHSDNFMHYYSISKLFLIMFTKELASHLQGSKILAVSTHPGFVASDIYSKDHYSSSKLINFLKPVMDLSLRFLARSSKTGAITSLHAALNPEISRSGDYYDNCKLSKTAISADDPKLRKEVWDKTFEVLDLTLDI